MIDYVLVYSFFMQFFLTFDSVEHLEYMLEKYKNGASDITSILYSANTLRCACCATWIGENSRKSIIKEMNAEHIYNPYLKELINEYQELKDMALPDDYDFCEICESDDIYYNTALKQWWCADCDCSIQEFVDNTKEADRYMNEHTPIHEQSKEYCKHCNKFVYYTIIDEEVNGYDYWWNKCTECGKHIHVFPCWSYIAAHSCSICRGIADELALERELEEE